MSAPTHTVLIIQQFLTKNCMTPMPHPPFSPNLAPCELFCLFPRMKNILKGKHCAYVEEVKQKMAEALKGIKIDKFKNHYKQWKKHLNRCITSNGEYLEDD